MTRYLVTIGVVVLIAATAVLWFAHRESVALDAMAAAQLGEIAARAAGEPVVIVREGPVRVVERERVVIQRVAPGAKPVGSATVETTASATGAPVVECSQPNTGEITPPLKKVRCPNPELGCRTTITGWRHATSGAVLATGTQTIRWKWPDRDWQESSADLTPENTTVKAIPIAKPPKWIAGFSLGLDDNADKRASVYGLRRIGGIRGHDLYASASGMVGGGDVVVAGGLAVGW